VASHHRHVQRCCCQALQRQHHCQALLRLPRELQAALECPHQVGVGGMCLETVMGCQQRHQAEVVAPLLEGAVRLD
jgi:hypothetical protein